MGTETPSVFLILGDCLRATDGTPDAMPFTSGWTDTDCRRAHAPGTWTLASYASLHSLEPPLYHGVTRRSDRLSAGQTALIDELRSEGYQTALFSENPAYSSQNGFHHGVSYVDESVDLKPFRTEYSPLTHVSGLDLGSALSAARSVLGRPRRSRNFANLCYGLYEQTNSPDPNRHPHHGRRIVSHVAEYLREVDGPTFCSINLLDTHNPYYAYTERGAERAGIELSETTRRALMAATDNREFLCEASPEVPEGARTAFESWDEIYEAQHAVYRAQVAEVDALIEDFVRETPDGAAEDALVVVSGDHGQLFGEEGMAGHHTSLHPGGVQVPCYVSFPSDWDASAASRFREPISLLGVARTLPAVASGEIDTPTGFLETVRQRSLTDGELMVCTDGPTWNKQVIAETPPSEREKLAVRRVAYVRGETLVEYSSVWESDRITRVEYDLADGERTPRESADTRPDNDEHARWLRSSPGDEQPSSEVNRRLQELGYV